MALEEESCCGGRREAGESVSSASSAKLDVVLEPRQPCCDVEGTQDAPSSSADPGARRPHVLRRRIKPLYGSSAL